VRLVSFKSLSICNFLSVGDTPIAINFQEGINVITGINYDKEDSKNGVGKSTVIDALYFALFGTTIREINKDLITNSFTKKTCEVKLEIQIDNNGTTNIYNIARTLTPTKCFLSKDGVDITHSTLAKTNEFIQKLLRSTSKVFQNSVIMTINNTVPFMAQSKIDKRKFIESVLNLEAFSEMLSLTREEYNIIKRDYEVLYAKNQTVEKSYNTSKTQLERFEENKQNRIKSIADRIAENIIKIDNFTKQIATLPDDVDTLIRDKLTSLNIELINIQKERRESDREVTTVKTNISLLEKQLREIEKDGASCTTCKRPFPEDDLKHKEQNKNEINDQLDTLSNDKFAAEVIAEKFETNEGNKKTEIRNIEAKRDGINKVKATNDALQTKIVFLTDNNNDLLQDQQNIAYETNAELEQTVQELETEYNNNKTEIEKLDNGLSVLECVKFVVSEEGVKSYIVKKILKVLNSRLAYYLQTLEANCLCQFNEYFDETITDEKGGEKSYFNFSGGERKRIDLACLFAFLDIRRMQGDVHFSTIFYDELLDSSLDDKGVELVVNILRERAEKLNENSYIITHRGVAFTGKVNNTIMLEKRNNFTYLL
jgi:DNA repair exonuclease SbcCD ATPase subunit